MQISASVVIYNTKIKDLDTIVKSYNPCNKRKLLIIDNSESINEDIEKYKLNNNIEYIFNNANLGYGMAHNLAIKKCIEDSYDYHVILNPDISFNYNILKIIIDEMENNQNIGLIMPKVLNPDGTIQYLCKLLPSPINLLFRRFLPENKITQYIDSKYILKDSGYNKIMNPPSLSGCFMFLRLFTIKKYDLFFDERFFMYCEDLDLVRRIHRVAKTMYYPKVSIIHNHARDSYKNKKMLNEHIKSVIKYFNKYGWINDKERRLENKKSLREIKQLKSERNMEIL